MQKRNKENSHICVTTVTSSRLQSRVTQLVKQTPAHLLQICQICSYVIRSIILERNRTSSLIDNNQIYFTFVVLTFELDYILRACICLCASCSLSSTSAKSARSRTRASSVLVSEATEAGQQYTRLFVCICWEMRRCFILAALDISIDRYILVDRQISNK